MKDKFRYTLPAQMLRILRTQSLTLFTMFVLWLLFINLITWGPWSLIYSLISSVIYFFAIYGSSYDSLRDDKKSYTKQNPIWWKGLILPAFAEILNVLMVILYKCAWSFGVSEDGKLKIFGIIGNLIYKIWTMPFEGYTSIGTGHNSLSAYIAIFGIPLLASFLGYLAGYKGFDLTDIIAGFMYEKKKDERKR